MRDDPPLEHPPARRDVEGVFDDLRPAAGEAAADGLHPGRGRRLRECLRHRGLKEGLARRGERLGPCGVNREVAPVPAEYEKEVRERFEERAQTPLALPQRFVRPPALDGEGHLGRDETEERLVLLAVPEIPGRSWTARTPIVLSPARRGTPSQSIDGAPIGSTSPRVTRASKTSGEARRGSPFRRT